MTVSHTDLFKSLSEGRGSRRAWAELGQEERERIAQLLCVADGHNPSRITHLQLQPLELIHSPEGIVLIYREQDWAPMWHRYLGMAQRFFEAGLLAKK